MLRNRATLCAHYWSAGACVIALAACTPEGAAPRPADEPDVRATPITSAPATSAPVSSGGSGAAGAPPAVDATSPPPDGAPGSCGASGAFFCENFDRAAAGAPPPGFIVESGGGTPGTIEVTSSVAHSGEHSVFVDGNVFSSQFTLKGALIAQAENSLYVRTWIRVGTAFDAGHSAFIEAGPDSLTNETEIRVGFHVNQLEVNRMPGDAEQLSNGGDYNDPNGGIHFVPGTWHCLEVFFDGARDELRVWFEGSEVVELHVIDWRRGEVDWSPPYEAVRFGYEKYSAASMQVWYDDIAVSREHIGCGE